MATLLCWHYFYLFIYFLLEFLLGKSLETELWREF